MLRRIAQLGVFLVLLSVPSAYATAFTLVPACMNIPGGCRLCDLVTLANNIIEFVLIISVFIAVLLLAVSGLKAVMSGGHHASEMVVGTVTNSLIGIIIALVAWVALDTGLKILLNGQFGPWNDIQCVSNPLFTGGGPGGSSAQPGGGSTPNNPYTGVTGGGVQCDAANTACSVQALKDLGFTDQQANVMSCIAMTESTGNPNISNPNGGACGTFQLLPWHWNNNQTIRNLVGSNGQACDLSNCTNVSCNALGAQVLMNSRISSGQSPYADWTCPNCNAKAQGCINQFGG